MLQAIRDEHPIIPKIERFRELSKLAQTYLDALPELDRRRRPPAHDVRAGDAATGRLPRINPNLQNIPIRTETGREIRACFIAEPGNVLLTVDYSPGRAARARPHRRRAGAARHLPARRGRPHRDRRRRLRRCRPSSSTSACARKAKMVNYGIVYGLSAYGLADRLQIPQEEAQEFIDRYLERFPAVAQFMKDAVTQAEQHGYVSTLFGRRRQIPEIRARNWQTRKLGERLAVNTVIQGTAADIIKVAMVRCHDALRRRGPEDPLILQIHDELLFEGPPEEMERATEIVTREMVGAAELDPPLTVDAGVGATGSTRSDGPGRRARRGARDRRRRRRPGAAELAARRATSGGLPATTIALGVSLRLRCSSLTADRRASSGGFADVGKRAAARADRRRPGRRALRRLDRLDGPRARRRRA